MSLKKISKDTALFYTLTFLLPMLLYSAVLLLCHWGGGRLYPNIHPYLRIPLLGIASSAFACYLIHTRSFHLHTKLYQLIFSVSYGMSSYILTQESDILILLAYSLFPILFLTFEWMVTDQKHFPFIIGNAVLLLACPLAGIPVTVLLFVLALLELSLQRRLHFGDFLHTVCNFLFSILLGSFGIIYHLAPYYAEHDTYAYEGFQFTNQITLFLSRFLPGGVSSRQFFFYRNKIDLYFGLFALILAILFFIQRKIAFRKRLYYGIFTLLLIAGIELSPLQYVLNLFLTTERYTVVYSFVLVFWALRLACESYSQVLQSTKFPIAAAQVISLAVIGVSWCFVQHNFQPWMFAFDLVLWAAAAFFLYACHTRRFSIAGRIVFCLMIAELSLNAVMVTDAHRSPESASASTQFIYQPDTAQENTASQTDTTANGQDADGTDPAEADPDHPVLNISQTDYESYTTQHTDKNTVEILQNLRDLDLLDEEGYRTYSGKLLPNDFEQFNALVKKIGLTKDLFTPAEVTLHFPENPYYKVTDLGNQIFQIATPGSKFVQPGYLPYQIQYQAKTEDPVYLLDTSAADLILLEDAQLSGTEYAYLMAVSPDQPGPLSINHQILCYTMDPDVLQQLPALIQTEEKKQQEHKPSYLSYDIIGIICSYVGLMILLVLLGYNHKERVYQHLYQTRTALSQASLVRRIQKHFSANRVYYLAFLIPVILLLSILVYTDCMPFGSNSVFDEDGIALALPELLDHYYNLQDDNTYLSMYAGYMTNVYSNTPMIKLFSFFQYLSIPQIIILQQLILILCTGLSGVTMVYYLVHRQNRPVSKQDLRLLIPAAVYSLNAYMLRCHSFNNWYYALLLFPLLLIAFQNLLNRRKWLAYTVILACCIVPNIQLGLYICIFLVIRFFLQSFAGWKDFFGKGLRFAGASVLAAGCSFFTLSNTLIASRHLFYQDMDSMIPSPGFHGSFLTEWKNYMIYSPATFVSHNDGDLFAYCGILTLFLTLAYFLSHQYPLREKIRKLIPIVLLVISFNGQVLSYLWNGMHYQSGAPNRYTFLLLFILAEAGYDGLSAICQLSRRIYAGITVGICLFFLACQSHSDPNTTLAFTATLCLCIVYLLLHLWYRHRHHLRRYLWALGLLTLFEFYSNGLYTGANWETNTVQVYGNIQQMRTLTSEVLADSSDFYRNIYVSGNIGNFGYVYHTPTTSAFGSFVSQYQSNLNLSHGFQRGTNYILNNFASNPMGLALSSTRYIFLTSYNTQPVQDLSQYNYIGYTNGYYVYENPDYLSLGFRVPESALQYDAQYENVLSTFAPHYHNFLAKEYLAEDANLCTIHPIQYDAQGTDAPDTFYYTDENDQLLTLTEAAALYDEITRIDTHRLKLHLNYTARQDGYLYLFANELDGIGYVHQGEQVKTSINIPNLNVAFSDHVYYMTILKPELFQEFYQKARQNQLEDIRIQNDTITGTTNYDEAGYTMFSLPYDQGWSAYIDGKEVSIENPYDAGLYVETPAGKHTLTLKFEPYGRKFGQYVTYGFWLFTLLLYALIQYHHRIRKQQTAA